MMKKSMNNENKRTFIGKAYHNEKNFNFTFADCYSY